ncbi:MAG: fructosamine kinase family protein [Burkholderiales bacterium]
MSHDSDAMPWDGIAARISDATAMRFRCERAIPASGGSINRAFVLEGNGNRYFVKLNQPSRAPMFEAEAAGLAALAATGTIRVPRAICTGMDAGCAWIVLEHLALRATGDWRQFGERLAALHRHGAQHFGWERDNTIGSTLQPNQPHEDWVVFLRERRLGHQLALALRNGHRALAQDGARLLERLPDFFTGYQPGPSLLHGDLWSGNAGFLPDGEAVIYDPAVYFGDREADLAMTELFGGFPPGFYHAYAAAWPLDGDYGVRKDLYNLYHLLNHLNLFGSGYFCACADTISRLLARTG